MTKKATGNPIDSPRGSRGSRTPGPGTPGPFRLSPSRCATAPRGMPKQFSDLFRASPSCVSFGNSVLRCAADAAKQRAGGFHLHHDKRSDREIRSLLSWEQRESNPRPSACKADALNQLSYAPKHPVSKQDCKYMEIFPNQQDFRRKFTENSPIRRKSQSSALQRKGGCWQDGSLRSGKSRASPNPCQGQCNRWNNSRGHPSRTICLRLP